MLARLPRSTGLLILGLVPSNYLIRIQIESSTAICVPKREPDGVQPARRWLQVEDGGPKLENPTWAQRTLF